MQKVCFVEQTCGLGDILLAIKIGNHFLEKDYRVIWPVEKTYDYINEYVSTNGIEFVSIDKDFEFKDVYRTASSKNFIEAVEFDNFAYIPLKRSFHSSAGKRLQQTVSHDEANMHGKFAMCALDSEGWQDCFELKRNEERENRLFQYLKIEDKDIHLINKNFGTPPRWKERLQKNIITPDDLSPIEMFLSKEFTIFDWLSVFEYAKKIDTVSTSTFYLFEKINLSCQPTIYSRNTSHRSYEENFNWLKKLARKEYTYVS